LQYPFTGQTAVSAQAPPIDTPAAHTVDVPLVGVSAQTRSSAHVPPRNSFGVQGCPRGTTAVQVPHPTRVVSEQRPLAHCQGVLQGPPLGTVPPRIKQAGGIPPWPRNVAQFMPAYPFAHCSASAEVQAELGATRESLQDAR
jgi:hypothetical protein